MSESIGVRITKGVILATPIVLTTYDLYMYVKYGNEATISRTILDSTHKFAPASMVAILLCGILIGHLWLPQHVQQAVKEALAVD